MIECLVLGDSIAVGLQQFKPECHSVAKGGINSWQFNKYNNQNFGAKTVIISLGSNDHKNIRSFAELQKLRSRVYADRVFWILPAGNLKASQVDIQVLQGYVRQIAENYGDTIVPITKLQSDQIHPSTAGYRELKEKTQ